MNSANPLVPFGAREREGKENHVSFMNVFAGGTAHLFPGIDSRVRWSEATSVQLLRKKIQMVLLGCIASPQVMGGGRGTQGAFERGGGEVLKVRKEEDLTEVEHNIKARTNVYAEDIRQRLKKRVCRMPIFVSNQV